MFFEKTFSLTAYHILRARCALIKMNLFDSGSNMIDCIYLFLTQRNKYIIFLTLSLSAHTQIFVKLPTQNLSLNNKSIAT